MALSPPAPNARYLWLFLMTGEFTTKIPGVNVGGRASMAEFLEWPLEDFDRCFAEIAAQKGTDGTPMVVADWKNRLVYLTSAFKQPDNHPHSTAEVVTWRKALNNLPECELRDRIEYDLRLALMEHSPSFLESFVCQKRVDLFSKRDNSNPLPAMLPAHADSGAGSTVSVSGSASGSTTATASEKISEGQSAHADRQSESASNDAQQGLLLPPAAMEPPFDVDEAFDEAYRLYPRKEGKSKGKGVFERQITGPREHERFVAAERNYIALVVEEKRIPKHIMKFSTFMNNWEDYAPGNFEPPSPAASRDLGRGQVPVARGLSFQQHGGPQK